MKISYQTFKEQPLQTNEIESFFKEHEDKREEYWCKLDKEYPNLVVSISKPYACAYFFPHKHECFESSKRKVIQTEGRIKFILGNEETAEVSPNAIISMQEAVEAVKHFSIDGLRPKNLLWTEV